MEKSEYLNQLNGIEYTNQCQLTSQFRFCGNCFRVDTYRSMYIKMTGDRSQWIPKCKINGCFLSDQLRKGWGYKDYVDNYYNTIYEDDRQLNLFDEPKNKENEKF